MVDEEPNEESDSRGLDVLDVEAILDEAVAAQVVLASRGYSGPLPSSTEFAGYGAVLPDAPHRILQMAEKSLEHQMETERRESRAEAALGLLGLVFALILALTILAGSIWLIADDKQVAGTMLATFDLVALVTVFIIGRRGSPN